MPNALSISGKKNPTLTIATRESKLALWQAKWVRKKILEKYSEITVELLPIKTAGDINQLQPLAKIGGKGLFVKELETSLLQGKADLAVHSMKDVTCILPEGLEISVIAKRDDPRDAWICPKYGSIDNFPKGATVGTSSLRRTAFIKYHRPDINVRSLRGNVTTRLSKLDGGEVDAIILAVSGLKRINLENRITEIIPMKWMLPAIGQGAIGIETRKGDYHTLSFLKHINDPVTNGCLGAERSLLLELEGNCQIPLAGYCINKVKELSLKSALCDHEGKSMIFYEARALPQNAISLGKKSAEWLLKNGGKQILQKSLTALK
ncbi:MAG: hydroxymethylbilane synthase [Deltaproteobacteria bacterium]|nr:hydroxymethylbilane synthase [Deltaproteobacteria bacterium]